MCEIRAFVVRADGEEMFLENVDIIRPEGDELYLKSLFGEEKRIKGKIKEISFTSNRVVIKPAG